MFPLRPYVRPLCAVALSALLMGCPGPSSPPRRGEGAQAMAPSQREDAQLDPPEEQDPCGGRFATPLPGEIYGGAPPPGGRLPEFRHPPRRHIMVTCAAFSPDDRLLLTGYHVTAQPHEPGYCQYVRLWDVASGQEVRVLKGHRDRVTSVAFLPDSKRALSASVDGTWRLWDVTTGRCLWVLAGGGLGPALPADGRQVLRWTGGAGQDSRLRLWDVDSERLLRTFDGDAAQPSALALSPEGKLALTVPIFGYPDDTLRLWDLTSGRVAREFEKGQVWGPPVAFSPDGKLAIAGKRGKDQTETYLVLWDVTTGTEAQRFLVPGSMVDTVAFTPDGKHLLAGAADSTIRRWEVSSGKELWCIQPGGTSAFAFSRDARLAFAAVGAEPPPVAGEPGLRLRIYDGTSGALIRALAAPAGQ
jgi:WD40 repeat protein